MKRASSFVAALAATLLAVSADAATPLFSETFSGNTGDWTSSSGGASFDNQGWDCTSTCKSQSAIKLGTGNVTGSALSPSIAITTGWSRASVTVSFQAAAWYGTKNCTATLSVLENNQTTTNVSWSVPPIAGTKNDALQIADLSAFTADANGKAYEVAFKARGPFQLKFETSGASTDEKRIYLDTVVVTAEEIVSVLPQLDPPANLVTNALSQTGFSVTWDAVTGATGYVVRVDGTVIANCGPSERTVSVSGYVAGSSHTVTVIAQGDGMTHEDSTPAQISVDLPAWPPAEEPDPVASGITAGSFSVSWTQHADETYAVRAWTFGPVDTVEEDFKEYPDEKPLGWTFDNGNKFYKTDTPVQLGDNGASVESPSFSAALTGVSFKLKPNTASGSSSVSVEGSADGIDWSSLTNVAVSGSTGFTVSFPIDMSSDIRKLRWTYTKDHGNVGFGKFVATGSGIGLGPTYLEGYGPVAAALGTSATCTFDAPVAGETNWVEVTATGPGGDTASKTIGVEVPADDDPWRPVWTVPNAVTGFPGKELSFTVSAALTGGVAQAVALVSGPDGATFVPATGAFAWTPAGTGETNAVFRVVNEGGTYERAVSISVEDPAKTEALFREDFSLFVTKWNGTSDPAAIADPPPDEAGWTFDKATRAPSSLRFGKDGTDATKAGSALSREIVLRNNLSSGMVALSFQAAAYFSKTTAMHVVVLDAETGDPVWTSPVLELAAIGTGLAKDSTLASVAEGVHTNASFSVPGVPERFRLLFETVQGTAADHRLYLDSILVSQSWDASIPALAAPVPSIDAAVTDSIDVSWTAVAGSNGYDMEVRRASDGSLAARLSGIDGTSATVDGLADGTSYEVRLRALGDGVSTANSPWSAAVPAQTPADPNRPDFTVSAGADAAVTAGTAKTFSVSASRGGKTVSVSFGGLSPDPAVERSARFAGGTFSWTPTDEDAGDAGRSFTATFLVGSYSTNVVFSVMPRPPLAAPTITVVSRRVKAATLAWNDQPRAASYGVRLWRGSEDYTRSGVCCEDFFDHVIPLDWFATGTPGTKWYQDADAPVQFEKTGDALITKLHSAPVTNLSFKTELNGSAGETPSSWILWASTGGTNATDWVSVGGTTLSTANKTFSFESSLNYRRFKWTFTKVSGNMGLGSVAAEHAGAGAKFVEGFGSAVAPQDVGQATTISCNTLRAGTEYFLEVTATDGTTSFSSVCRFSTLPAPKATVMILR